MGQPLSTLRELVGAIPGTVKDALPDSVTAIPETVVNAIPGSVKAIPGTVMAVPGKLLAYPQAILERLKALLPGSLKSLPGRLKKEDNKVSEIVPEVQAVKIVPTEAAPPKSGTPEESVAVCLMEFSQEVVDARRDEIENLDQVLPASVVQTMQQWEIGYIPLFFAAATYYNMVTLKPRGFSCFLKLKDDWPIHFLWGAGNGICACLAASLFPPYTKWLVILLVGVKWCHEVSLMFSRSRGWLDDGDESDIEHTL